MELYHLARVFEIRLPGNMTPSCNTISFMFSAMFCDVWLKVSMTLPLLSPVLNPIIYSFLGKKFRYQLKTAVKQISIRIKYDSTSDYFTS